MSPSALARSDLRDARVLAAAELRIRLRAVRGNRRRLAALAFMGFLFGVVFPLSLWGSATGFGRQIASGSVPLGDVGAVLAATAAAGTYLGGASGFNQESAGTIGPLVRTAISPTAVSLGRLASESAQAASLVVVPTIALGLAVGVGAGGPVPAVVLVLGALPLLLASLLVGRILGAAVRYGNRVLQVSLWTKALLFVVASVAVYAGTYALLLPRMEDSGAIGAGFLPAFLPGEPLQAYASVAFAVLGATPRPLGVVLAVGFLATVPVVLLVALRVETWLLLSDPRTAAADDAGAAVESRAVPRPFTVSPSGRVAWRYLLRTRRDPRMLAHLVPFLFGALGMGATFVRDPHSVFSLGPAAAVVGGATLAGATFCLNPLGDDLDQLPLFLSSTRSTAVLLRGRALAGMVLGLAVAVGLAVPLGLVRGSVLRLVAEILLAVVLAAAGTGTALGVGALVPRFERREYMSVERAHPSMLVLLGFLFGGTIVGGVGIFLVSWSVHGPPVVPAVLVWAGYLGVVGGTGAGSYRYAVRRFDRLTLDDV